jgi:hypothetical protein
MVDTRNLYSALGTTRARLAKFCMEVGHKCIYNSAFIISFEDDCLLGC